MLNRKLEKGSHLEELLGEKQLHDIIARGAAAHKDYGTYVLDQGIEILYHLSGRRAVAVLEHDSIQSEVFWLQVYLRIQERIRYRSQDPSPLPDPAVPSFQLENTLGRI